MYTRPYFPIIVAQHRKLQQMSCQKRWGGGLYCLFLSLVTKNIFCLSVFFLSNLVAKAHTI